MKLIENFTYRYILLAIIFGMFLYDIIGKELGFRYIDELLLVVLLLYTCIKVKFNREIKCFIGIYIFYIVYSLIYGVACKEAIITDAIIYLKPFIGFYGAFSLGMALNDRQKKSISKIVALISITVLIACMMSYEFVTNSLMGHPSRLATLYQVLGAMFFYCSKRKKKDIIVTFIIFVCSILSVRSKSYAFVAAFLFLFYFMKVRRFEKISLSTIISIFIGLSFIFIAAWEKFQFYFITGSSDDISESFARPALYQGAWLILKDFFPLGPGFGSYACYASSVYYSPLYYQYGLNYVWGLSLEHRNFISDTFFPQLAQFGLLGVILFFTFFHKRYKQTIYYYRYNKDEYLMKMNILIILFFMIESAVDSTLVHNRGMIMMVILGMLMSESKSKCIVKHKIKII